MKMMKWIFLAILAVYVAPIARAQNGAITNFCTSSATNAVTQGLASTNTLQGIVPYCTITVYTTGTTTLATLSTNPTGTPLANPFLAGSTGQWNFYAPASACYDVVMSGGFGSNTFAFPVTIVDVCPSGGSSFNLVNPTLYPGADLSAQIAAAQAAACSSGCTISVPVANYTLAGTIAITQPNVKLMGNGAIISSSQNTSIRLQADNDTVSGFNFSFSVGSTYGIISTAGKDQKIEGNTFTGSGGTYIAVSLSPSGALISRNTFDGSNGCAYAANVSVFESAHFDVSDNRVINTCGFAFTVLASNHGTVHDNTIDQVVQTQSITSSAAQTVYTFTWLTTFPTVNRVWAQVNGVPTTATVVYTTATSTQVTLGAAPTTGSTVTALGWTSLENIQVNSQSFDVTVTGNTVHGSGDAGIDVVSDYHMVSKGSATATQNQSAFSITAGSALTASPAVVIGGRVLAADRVTITNVGLVYTITTIPQPAGTVVTLMDFTMNQGASVQADYPGSVVIANNIVTGAASAGITPEISATNVVIEGNTIEDCGQGVQTAAYSTGIFTGNATGLVVKNNTIANTLTVPTMNSAISIQEVGVETGSIEKSVQICGNTYLGTFSAGALFAPPFSTSMNSGFDICDARVIPYPEQPNLDEPWTTIPPSTRYLTYAYTIAAPTRSTTNVIGGIASMIVNSGGYVSITPTNQIFFANSVIKVTFWAKNITGTPRVIIFGTYSGTPAAVANVVSTNWQQYSLYASTSGVTNLLIQLDGTQPGSMAIQNITIAASPFVTASTTATGTSSTTPTPQYFDSVAITGCATGTYVKADGSGCGTPSGTFTVSSFTGGSTVEVGAAVTNPSFTAAYSGGTATAASITNTAAINSPFALTSPFTSATITGNFTQTTVGCITFTLTPTPTATPATATQQICNQLRFFGGLSATNGATGATASGTTAVLTGATGTLNSLGVTAAQTGTFSFSPSGQYIYLLLQGGSHTFTVNSFATTFTSTAITFTNQYGVAVATEYLYVSPASYTGTYSVVVN